LAKIFTYNKKEKLKSRKLLQQLFTEGKSFTVFPIKVIYLEVKAPLDFPVKVAVGASGRNFKKAVQRNRIKRLLRECYRTEKIPLHSLLEQQNKELIVFLLYIDKVLPEYAVIKTKMPLIIQKLIKALNEKNSSNN
jgi:ribonuclease P protein component